MDKKTKKSSVAFLAMLIITIVGIIGLAVFLMWQENRSVLMAEEIESSETSSEPVSEISEPEEEPVPEPAVVRLMGVGDDLIHDGLYIQANKRAGGNGYDFNYAYENVREILSLADISSINQETLLASVFEPSAYPMFNSPTELGDLLVDLGFDVVNHANNHSIDKGVKGISSTLDFWQDKPDVKVTGFYRNREDYEKVRMVERNGITFGFVGMTELTNGLSLPADTDIILMRTSDEAEIKAQIERAKAVCDVVVVNVHWGVEYTHQPNAMQKDLAKKMVDWGADIILGHHPHVIQPVEYITREDGTRAIVAYSLGNFISMQSEGPRMVGGLLDLNVKKDFETNEVTIDSARFVPIVTHYDKGYANGRNYTLEDYTAELALAHGVRANTPDFSIEYINNIVTSVIDEEFLTSYKEE